MLDVFALRDAETTTLSAHAKPAELSAVVTTRVCNSCTSAREATSSWESTRRIVQLLLAWKRTPLIGARMNQDNRESNLRISYSLILY